MRTGAAALFAAAASVLNACAPDASGRASAETPVDASAATTIATAVDWPKRVVSLDYCADQFVLKFVDRANILAVSPDATADFSYMREAASGVPTVRPLAEDVLIAKPDLVVRLYGGGPNATTFFERAGVPVLNVGWSGSIDDVAANVERLAAGLGAADEGRAVVADMRDRLAALAQSDDGGHALYMTPAGVTTGPGSLIHEMIVAAGLANFQEASGWRSLPLERLAYERPDLVAAAFFETRTNHADAWSPAGHPVARAQLDGPAVARLDGAWTACGAWFLVDAVEALAAASVAAPVK
ncbi:MAG: ABC transporter substrate-binding protein [Pseudomonadota bacterium]